MSVRCIYRLLILYTVVLFTTLAPSLSIAQVSCPSPPNSVTSVNRDVRTEIGAQVGALGRLKLGDLSIKTETVAKNLFAKYPNLDQLVALELMSSTYCSILRESKIPDTEKLDRWERFQSSVLGIRNSVPSKPARSSSGVQPHRANPERATSTSPNVVQGNNTGPGVQIGANSGSIIVMPPGTGARPIVSPIDFSRRVNDVRRDFHRGTFNPTALISEVETLLAFRSDSELQLIRVLLFAYQGQKQSAEQALEQITGIADAAELRLIKRMYSLFVSMYDATTRESIFTSETFFSISGESLFFGPNLAAAQYKQWQRAFSNIWLILPLFNSNSNSARAPRTFYASLIEDQPSLGWAYTMIAWDSLDKGLYEQSATEARRALEIDADQPRAFRARAIANEHLDNVQKSLDDYGRSLAIQPLDAITYMDRGILLDKLERFAESFKDYDRAVELSPRYYRAYNARGLASLRLGELQPALRDFAFVISASKDSTLRWRAMVNSVTAYTVKGDFQVARVRMSDDDFKSMAEKNGPESAKTIAALTRMIDSQEASRSKSTQSAPAK